MSASQLARDTINVLLDAQDLITEATHNVQAADDGAVEAALVKIRGDLTAVTDRIPTV